MKLGSPSEGGCATPGIQASFFACQQEGESGRHQELDVARPGCLSHLPLIFSFSCKSLQVILTPTPSTVQGVLNIQQSSEVQIFI